MSAAVVTLSFSQRNMRDAFRPCPLFSSIVAAGRAQAGEGRCPGTGQAPGAAGPRLRPGGNLGKEGCRGQALEHTQGNRTGTEPRQ